MDDSRTSTSSARHDATRATIRWLGFLLAVAGGILALIGLVSFFGSFASFSGGPPRYFWCAFVGLPVFGIGLALLRLGYLGRMAAYTAEEVVPVVGAAARQVAGEVAEGLAQARSGTAEERLRQLDRLQDAGLITREEHARKRASVIEGI